MIVVIEAAISPQLGGSVDLPSGIERRSVLLFLGATVAFVILLPTLGQYVAAVLYATAIIKLLSDLSWIRSVLFGVALGGGISLAFMTILQIRLPVGLFGGF
jgi:putative tricarboxylic transport membrane protein